MNHSYQCPKNSLSQGLSQKNESDNLDLIKNVLGNRNDKNPAIKCGAVHSNYELFVFNGKTRKMPYFISMQKTDNILAPNSVLNAGSQAVRKYFNNKNLRKRGTILEKDVF